MASAAASALGLALEPRWLAAADAAGRASSAGDLLAAFLAADMNAAGGGCLPADGESWSDRVLAGRYVLQIDEVVNAAAPAKQRYTNAGGARLLKLLLTDGRRHVVAFELEHVPCLRADMEPGAKVAITDALVLNGMLALRPPNVALLGGRCDRLASARARALSAVAAPPTGAAAGDGPDLVARARAAAWDGVEATATAAAAAAPLPAAAGPPPVPAPPPPPATAPKPDPDAPILILSDAEDDDDPRGDRGGAPPPPPPWPRAPLAVAAAAPAPTLARARVAGVASALRFMDAASAAPLAEFGLDVDLTDSAAPAAAVAATLAHPILARLLDGASPADLVALYAAQGEGAVLEQLAGVRAGLQAFDGWVGVRAGAAGGRAVVEAWWPA